MRKVLFAHGKPPREKYENPTIPMPHEANWFPWIKQQLSLQNIEADIPVLPKPYHPVFSDWKEAFPVYAIDTSTGLVGFSAGAEFLLRLLSEEPQIYAEKLVLIAPWRDLHDSYGDFSKYSLDPELSKRVGGITIISSRDDSEAIQSNAHSLAQKLPSARLMELDGYGHFMIGNNMTSEEFPELFDILTN